MMRYNQNLTTFDDEANYNQVMQEAFIVHTVNDFLDVCRSEGFYNMLIDVERQCGALDLPLFKRAIIELSKKYK